MTFIIIKPAFLKNQCNGFPQQTDLNIIYKRVLQHLPQTSSQRRRTWNVMDECCVLNMQILVDSFFLRFWLLRDLKSQVWYFTVSFIIAFFSISCKYLPVHEIFLWLSRSLSLCNVLLFFPISPRSWDFSLSCRASSFYAITSWFCFYSLIAKEKEIGKKSLLKCRLTFSFNFLRDLFFLRIV